MYAIAVSYVCETTPAPQLPNCIIICLKNFLRYKNSGNVTSQKLLNDVGGTWFTELSDTNIVQQNFWLVKFPQFS